MPLTLCHDLTPAAWIVDAELPLKRLVTFGPAGFEAHARLRYLPDPAYQGQSVDTARAADTAVGVDLLRLLLDALAGHTATPHDCYFCVPDDFARLRASAASDTPDDHGWIVMREEPLASIPPAQAEATNGPGAAVSVPNLTIGHQRYRLFRGPLADSGDWGIWAGEDESDAPDPAFVWPADRAWCVASDTGTHWAGIAADRSVIARLVADTRVDVVPADPTEDQPAYG